MIQVVMFDIEALIDRHQKPYPHLIFALETLDSLAISTCIISDLSADVSEKDAMSNYDQILTTAGLKPFFTPIEQRLTLSMHAGVLKPNRKIFEKGLERLGEPKISLMNCLYVAKNGDHLAWVRLELQMKTLQFGIDFTDWSQFPATFSKLFSSAETWVAVSIPNHADLENILVQVPGTSPSEIDEVRSYVAGLAANGKIAGRGNKPTIQPTHVLKEDEEGKRRLVRTGFSAITNRQA